MTDFGERRRVLPKTGQTTSYRDGDDGYYQKGWFNGPRFKDVGDGTVVDAATGLMWPKDWTGPGGKNGDDLNWNDAIDYAEGLSFAGHDDWRLPSLAEGLSLMDRSLHHPAIGAPFTNTGTVSLHVSTTYAFSSPASWFVEFTYGATAFNPKTNTLRLLCCRDA